MLFASPATKTKGKAKRVETFFATCLDGGSIPPGSTKKRFGWRSASLRTAGYLGHVLEYAPSKPAVRASHLTIQNVFYHCLSTASFQSVQKPDTFFSLPQNSSTVTVKMVQRLASAGVTVIGWSW